MTILFWLAIVNLVVAVAMFVQFFLGMRQVGNLRDRPVQWGDELPVVSVVVPARNEERHIEEALQSLLALDYPDLEITVVDDRSTDGTAAILDRMARQFPALNIVHVEHLPAGWLGKNHAMQLGADRSRGEWLLFTDADVVFDRSTIRRAVPYAIKHHVDHLVLAPDTRMPNWLLQSFVVGFAVFFYLYLRPWRVRNPKSRAHIGIGAFNLLRADRYRAMGGHVPIAMRPDDDLKLGKLVKKHGFRQELLNGIGLVRVEWYATLREMVVGLEKNSFAVVEYSVLAIVASSLALLLFDVWPFLALLATSGTVWWIYLACCLVLVAMTARTATSMNYPISCAFAFPLAALIMVWIQWRSTVLALKNKGIRWRDTHYSLDQLRANRV